jgi:hypothetical protein
MPLRDHHDTLDAGPRNIAPGSHRRCAVSGEVKPVEEMIRFVIGPDHAPFVDLKRRLPGRGLWITATRQALELAIRRKVFERSFVRDIRLSHDFLQRTEHVIERAALDALAIAHKAGKVAIGFGKVEAALANATVVGILHAEEAAADGVHKLEAALSRSADIPIVRAFNSAQLDLALGRSNVIHAALLAGRESETFLVRVARLACFRTGPSGYRPGSGKSPGRNSETAELRSEVIGNETSAQ